MAVWDKIGSSGNVEDRRGMGGAGIAIGGVGSIVLFVLFAFLSSQGVDTSVLDQIVGQTGTEQTQQQSSEFAGDDNYEVFTKRVLGSNNDVWASIFGGRGLTYQEPKLVLFRDVTQSACGGAMGAYGPHYCPEDQTIYLDERFFADLEKQYGGNSSDVAQAYVISHEVGHHVQNLTGELSSGLANDNETSIKQELQSDCYAGVWMYSLTRTAVLEPGEIRQAIEAAAAVGDDNIQKKSQGYTTPENWTHGSSKQRVDWFTKGYESGRADACRVS